MEIYWSQANIQNLIDKYCETIFYYEHKKCWWELSFFLKAASSENYLFTNEKRWKKHSKVLEDIVFLKFIIFSYCSFLKFEETY